MDYQNIFFKTSKIPYCECRHTIDSINHYKPHIHKSFSIGAIESGVSEFIGKNSKVLLKNNTLVAINPFVLHACNPLNSTARSYYMLYLDKGYCYNLQKSIFKDIDEFLPVNDILIEDRNVVDSYFMLVKTLFSKEALILEKEAVIESFCIELFSRYCDKKRVVVTGKSQKEEIEIIKNYLKKNLTKNPNLNELAEVAKISKYHLIRTFKKYEGITPHKYLLNLKIEYAKELLSKNMPISFVALEVGLNDQSHLNRIFKQYFACTPKEYKKVF